LECEEASPGKLCAVARPQRARHETNLPGRLCQQDAHSPSRHDLEKAPADRGEHVRQGARAGELLARMEEEGQVPAPPPLPLRGRRTPICGVALRTRLPHVPERTLGSPRLANPTEGET